MLEAWIPNHFKSHPPCPSISPANHVWLFAWPWPWWVHTYPCTHDEPHWHKNTLQLEAGISSNRTIASIPSQSLGTYMQLKYLEIWIYSAILRIWKPITFCLRVDKFKNREKRDLYYLTLVWYIYMLLWDSEDRKVSLLKHLILTSSSWYSAGNITILWLWPSGCINSCRDVYAEYQGFWHV